MSKELDYIEVALMLLAPRNSMEALAMANANKALEHLKAVEQKRALDLPICQRCQVEKQILYRCPHCQSLESASQ